MIDVRLSSRFPSERPADVAVLFQFSEEARPWGSTDSRLVQRIGRLARGDSFRGRRGQSFLWHAGTRVAKRWLLIGLGDRQSWDVQQLRQVCAIVVQRCRQIGARSVSLPLADPRALDTSESAVIERMVAALASASLRFDKYRSKPEKADALKRASIHVPGKLSSSRRGASERGKLEARAIQFTQELVNEPGGALPPRELAVRAQRMARRTGLTCRVLDEAGLKRQGMGAILGVGAGSSQPPRLIHLSYRPKGRVRSKVALVGKGITFDSSARVTQRQKGRQRRSKAHPRDRHAIEHARGRQKGVSTKPSASRKRGSLAAQTISGSGASQTSRRKARINTDDCSVRCSAQGPASRRSFAPWLSWLPKNESR